MKAWLKLAYGSGRKKIEIWHKRRKSKKRKKRRERRARHAYQQHHRAIGNMWRK